MAQQKIIVIPGSCRSGSVNTRLAAAIVREIDQQNGAPTRISLDDYPLPIYNGDDEQSSGVPENAVKLAQMIAAHDGVVIVSPEYNSSLAPLLKNAMDWISRPISVNGEAVKPYQNRAYAIASASPGALGGIRGLAQVRQILVSVGASAITEQVAVGSAGSAFDDLDQLTNDRAKSMLSNMVASLLRHASWYARG
ncbi:MAG: NAD(P)H-dependent oxidoreductase [Pseudomonadota bacterium]